MMGLQAPDDLFWSPVPPAKPRRGVSHLTLWFVASAAFSVGALLTMPGTGDGASIGGQHVPASLDCEEDELIGYVSGVLDCVHLDTLEDYPR